MVRNPAQTLAILIAATAATMTLTAIPASAAKSASTSPVGTQT